MSLYNLKPDLAFACVTILHAIGGFSFASSLCAFYFLLFKTPKKDQAYARYLIHVQVWVVAFDLVVCLLFVPTLLFPLYGAVAYGVFAETGLSPHYLVILALIALGNIASSINWCFHFRYQTVMGAVGVELNRYRTFAFRTVMMLMMLLPSIVWTFLRRLDRAETRLVLEKHQELTWILARNSSIVLYGMDDFATTSVALPIAFIASFGNVSATVTLALLTFRALHKHAHALSVRTRDMQRKLIERLIIQAVAPVVIVGIPGSVYVGATVFEAFRTSTCNIFFCVLAMHSIVHSALVIFLSDTYRGILLRWFKVGRVPQPSSIIPHHGSLTPA